MYDEDANSVHGLLFEEADGVGVAGCNRGLCESQCSHVGVIACVFVDTSYGCPKTPMCESFHKAVSIDRV